VGSIAAGFAAFATGFISYTWLTLDSGPADPGSRAGPNDLFVSQSIQPNRVNLSPVTVDPHAQGNSPLHLASLETGEESATAFRELEDQTKSSARSSFGERFPFDLASEPSRFSQLPQAIASFDDRFNSEAFAASTAVPSPPARSVVAPASVAQGAPKRPTKTPFQLASASDTSLPLSYAPTDSVKGSGLASSLKGLTPKDADPLADVRRTAIYDITARTVYLPNGRRLEAHSGLGDRMDDPRYVNVRMTGPTPPNVYKLKMREGLFHGVRAIRLVPTDDSKMHGRGGILAHSYMLGPSGQSNGCVSFSNYSEFLVAYQRGEVNRLVVVERLAVAPSSKTASDWLSNTLKDIFRGS
jgi:hypothetical protein